MRDEVDKASKEKNPNVSSQLCSSDFKLFRNQFGKVGKKCLQSKIKLVFKEHMNNHGFLFYHQIFEVSVFDE